MHLAVLASLVLSAIATMQDLRVPLPVPPFREGLPSPRIDLTWNVRLSQDERGVFRTQAYLDSSIQRVRLTWQWFPAWPTAKGRRCDSSHIDFDGTLTALAVLESGSLVVAGAGRGASAGRMRLERIDLGLPEFDLQAGEVRAGREVARRTLWECEQPDRKVIAQLARWPGEGPPRLVAMMWDTPEILAFDVVSGACSRLAAVRSFGETGVLDVPELVRTYHRLSVRNHLRHGYVLVLDPTYGCFSREEDRLLVLTDFDRDGVLDRGILLDDEGWGLANSKEYVR